jgi:hypothetical protein
VVHPLESWPVEGGDRRREYAGVCHQNSKCPLRDSGTSAYCLMISWWKMLPGGEGKWRLVKTWDLFVEMLVALPIKGVMSRLGFQGSHCLSF